MHFSALKYTYSQFLSDFPTNDACLEYLFNKDKRICICGSTTFYRVKGRLSYVCRCGKQIHPLKGTIFEKSRTPLRAWFFIIYLFATSKNGVAATEGNTEDGGNIVRNPLYSELLNEAGASWQSM